MNGFFLILLAFPAGIYFFEVNNGNTRTTTQLTFTCSNSPIETLEKGVKYVQSCEICEICSKRCEICSNKKPEKRQ